MRRAFAVALLAPAVFAARPALCEPAAFDALPPLARPSGLSPYLEARLDGTLTFVCGRTDAFAWAWILRASEATLREAGGRKLGTFAARTAVIPPPPRARSHWIGADGGVAITVREAGAQFPGDDRAWDRHAVQAREGAGLFTAARSIIRVSTAWRIRPEAPCDAARSGAVARLPYRGTALFLK